MWSEQGMDAPWMHLSFPEFQQAIRGVVMFVALDAETGELSEKIGRGKNTTRHTELIRLDEDTYIMDTPGYSSIEVLCHEEDELADYFREFRPYLGECRFTGCRHVSEPDCKVKEAVAEGTVSQDRYESYKQILIDIMGKRKY